MKIATWNVNSVRTRASHVGHFLAREVPDILFLQELKCEAGQFPSALTDDTGYTADIVGQKSYNGVAVLARVPVTVTRRTLPGLPPDDAQARFIEVHADGLALAGLYLPNGNSGGDAGYAYKLAWMDALCDYADAMLADDQDFAILGDFNVCPTDEDFAAGTLPAGDALVRPETRARYRRMLHAGLTDAVRAMQPTGRAYTFWDYQAGAWPRDQGLRIDHALLSPALAERLTAVRIAKDERAAAQPSDHVPVIVTIS